MAKKFISLDRLGTFLDQIKKLIPTVNNPTITIKQAGSSKGTFTLNQSGATTIELTDNNTTYSAATISANGLMSSTDKAKLDGIAEKANAYSLPTATNSVLGGVKTGSNITNSSGTISLTKDNVTSALGYTPPKTDTTYPEATSSVAGLMSVEDKRKLNTTNIAYATCSTAAATAAKVATISDNYYWTLTVGAIVCVKYTYSNSASNCTLNVNNTGAKSFYYSTGVYTGTNTDVCGYANIICYYMYDGTYWVWLGKGYDVNSTYNPMTLGSGYGTCATAETTTAKVATLPGYNLITGGMPAIKFTYAVPASATLNINSRGAKAIYFQGAAITAGVIEAGDLVTFIYNGSQYHVLSIDKTANLKAKTRSELETIWSESSVPDIASQLTEIESVNATKIENEITRAKAAESVNATKIENEITRAKTAESTLTTDLASEVTRAKTSENTLTTDLASEITRAKTAESANATNIANLETKVDGLFTVVSTW